MNRNPGERCNLIEKLSLDTPNNLRSSSSYQIYNHPISLNDDRISYDTMLSKISDIGISLTILCAFSFIPAGLIVYIVRERITQEKRLQYVCGVRPFLYWINVFVWDFVYYIVIMLLTVLVIVAFNSSAYTTSQQNFSALIILLIMFGWSCLPMSYMLSKFFKDTGTAYMIIFCFTLFSGIATCVTVFLLSFIADNNASTKFAFLFMDKFSLLFPSYNLGSGLIEITKNQIMAEAYAKFGIYDVYKDPFRMDMLGFKLLALAVTGALFFLGIVWMESSFSIFGCLNRNIDVSLRCFVSFYLEINNFFEFFKSNVPAHLEDHDVSLERQRIQNNEARSDILVVKNLTKRYRYLNKDK